MIWLKHWSELLINSSPSSSDAITGKRVCWPPKGQEETKARNFLCVCARITISAELNLSSFFEQTTNHICMKPEKLEAEDSSNRNYLGGILFMRLDETEPSRRIDRRRNSKESSSSAAKNQSWLCVALPGSFENETKRKSKQQQSAGEGCFCEKGDDERGRWKWPCPVSWLDSIMTSPFFLFFLRNRRSSSCWSFCSMFLLASYAHIKSYLEVLQLVW